MKKFENKTVIVTGAARGIGYAVAEAFAREGARTALCDIDEAEAAKAADNIAAACGTQSFGAKVNVASSEECDNFIKDVIARLGGLDILVNNAGITRDNLAVRMSDEEWDAVLDVNLKGAFFMSRAALKHMMRERSGRLINITSVVGQMGNGGQANYSASKAGLIGLTKSLAREFSSRNVLVNAVAPGFVQTRMTDGLKQEAKDKLLASIPLGRFASARDIAGAVMFLAGEDSAYITGQVLAVNGGLYI